jgi:hypothetical protein
MYLCCVCPKYECVVYKYRLATAVVKNTMDLMIEPIEKSKHLLKIIRDYLFSKASVISSFEDFAILSSLACLALQS